MVLRNAGMFGKFRLQNIVRRECDGRFYEAQWKLPDRKQPPELIKKATESIKEAADMGNVAQIKSIAKELKSESDAMAPFCHELVRLAENFDFDGIQTFVLELDS